MKIIYLGKNNQYETKVSDRDYAYLMRWRWNFKMSDGKNGKRIYARRGGGRGRPTILMHTVILERKGESRPSAKHTADHGNRDSLDNQRENLSWKTKRQQNLNRDMSPTPETESNLDATF